jgi:hypothetical protein
MVPQAYHSISNKEIRLKIMTINMGEQKLMVLVLIHYSFFSEFSIMMSLAGISLLASDISLFGLLSSTLSLQKI